VPVHEGCAVASSDNCTFADLSGMMAVLKPVRSTVPQPAERTVHTLASLCGLYMQDRSSSSRMSSGSRQSGNFTFSSKIKFITSSNR
jgi:hypothetical protein